MRSFCRLLNLFILKTCRNPGTRAAILPAGLKTKIDYVPCVQPSYSTPL